MIFDRSATLALAAQIFLVLPGYALADAIVIQAELMEELDQWIEARSDLPEAPDAPIIEFVDAEEISDPGEMASLIGAVPRGLYDQDTGTITLVRPWSPEDPQDVSVLLHELVHHRQGGRHYYCEAAKEHAAYHLQKDWLAERDLSLDVNWIAVVLASSCSRRDVHP